MPVQVGFDTLKTRRKIISGNREFEFYSINALQEQKIGNFSSLPAALKVVLENLLRFEDGGRTVSVEDIKAFKIWLENGGKNPHEIAYRPARILMQDFTGVPAVVDLAAMREGIIHLGGDPKKINPLAPVDLVIDHSVMIDSFGTHEAFKFNVEREYERNMERYAFLKWGQSAFDNFRVVPPGTGICHQVNLEYIAQTIWSDKDQHGIELAYPDTLVGTDSHTTMINGIGVLGWGVGGIEAEAAMLGQPISMLIPEVIGFNLSGEMREGATGTDLVLKIVELLRQKGVVGKFVEFFGDGLDYLSLADRATISNMAPEYGATCGFFPIDSETLRYLENTGRAPERISLVEAYAKENGLWRDTEYNPTYSDQLALDIGTIVPAISGPKRPQDYIPLTQTQTAFHDEMNKTFKRPLAHEVKVEGEKYSLKSGQVVIASITSCTNTSNPAVMIGAGLLARKAAQCGLNRKPWVKTSLAPGSQVVSAYLEAAGLQKDLDAIGFNLVGYGCTTCIGNSGPLQEEISQAIREGDLVATAVLSGNRNFEGRISPDVRANYLASPPLVVAYALAGTMDINFFEDALGHDQKGNPVYLKDIWPSSQEIAEIVENTVTRKAFIAKYNDVFKGDEKWQNVEVPQSQTYGWPSTSTYLQKPPYFTEISKIAGDINPIKDARILAILGDMITTDHISPAGSFTETTPAGIYLTERQVPKSEFNSYGARRGNHEIMMRGTFANIRIKNEMLDNVEGGYSLDPNGNKTTIYDAAMAYQTTQTALIVIGGAQYGAGSSRDWAAKGTALLGVKAVIANSFERIHRSNLVGMGVIPFEFTNHDTRKTLALQGREKITIEGLENILPRQNVKCIIEREDGTKKEITLKCRIDTEIEIDYVRHGGVLHYVLRNLAQEN